MKITIDLSQSPLALRKELDSAVRFALGASFYIEQGTQVTPAIDPKGGSGNFTASELADPSINLTGDTAPSVSVVSTPTSSGVAALPTVGTSPATPTSGVEVDSEGHPYDVRIHSGGKTKIGNGTWKLAKGMAAKPEYVAQINAQNKSLMATPLPAALPVSNVVALPTLPATTVAALPDLPALPPVAAVAAPDAEIVVTDYPSFAQYVAQQVLIRPAGAKGELDKGLAHYGLVDASGAADLTALAHRPDVVAPLYGWFKAVVGLLPVEVV